MSEEVGTYQRVSRPGLIRLAEEVAENPRKPTLIVRKNLGPLVRSLSRGRGVWDTYSGSNEVQAQQTSNGGWVYRDDSGRRLSMGKVYDWLKSMVLSTYTMSLACWKGGYGNAIRYERDCALDRKKLDPSVLDILLAG